MGKGLYGSNASIENTTSDRRQMYMEEMFLANQNPARLEPVAASVLFATSGILAKQERKTTLNTMSVFKRHPSQKRSSGSTEPNSELF